MTLSPAQRRSLAWAAIAVAPRCCVAARAGADALHRRAVLAYALHPAVARWRARVPPVAVLLVEVLFIVALLAVLLLIVPIISRSCRCCASRSPLLADRLN